MARLIEPADVVAEYAKTARALMRQWMTANSCIGAVRTTIEVMRLYGLRAVEKPVCYVFQVPARHYARVGGFSAAEQAEMKARAASWKDTSTGGWNGHLLVLVEDRWLLDPSLDQAEAPEFGVSIPAEVFVIDTQELSWNPQVNFDMEMGLVLDNGDHASLRYSSIEDRSYLDTEAWADEGLPLLARAIAWHIEIKV